MVIRHQIQAFNSQREPQSAVSADDIDSCLRRNDALNKKSASLILPLRKFFMLLFLKPSNPHIELIYTYRNGYYETDVNPKLIEPVSIVLCSTVTSGGNNILITSFFK